jgi:hypothetical protein
MSLHPFVNMLGHPNIVFFGKIVDMENLFTSSIDLSLTLFAISLNALWSCIASMELIRGFMFCTPATSMKFHEILGEKI